MSLYIKGHFWEKYEWGELLICLGHLAIRNGPRQSAFFRSEYIFWRKQLDKFCPNIRESERNQLSLAESEIIRRLSLSSCNCRRGWPVVVVARWPRLTHTDLYPRNAPLSPPPPPAPRHRRHRQGKVVVGSQIRRRPHHRHHHCHLLSSSSPISCTNNWI